MREEGAFGQRALSPELRSLPAVYSHTERREDKLKEGLLNLKEPKLDLAMGQPQCPRETKRKAKEQLWAKSKLRHHWANMQENEAKGSSPQIIG